MLNEEDKLLAQLAEGETLESLMHSFDLTKEEAQYMLDMASILKGKD